MMKKLALVATGFVCAGLLGACSSQGMATSTKDMSQQTAKAGDRQPSGKKVKDVSLQGVGWQDLPIIRLQREESLPQILGFLVLYLPVDIRATQMI